MSATDTNTTADPKRTFNVVLFGWADGVPAHIAKYQAAYPPGCDFFVMPSAVWDVGQDPQLLIHQAEPVIDFLSQRGHIRSSTTLPASPSKRGTSSSDRGLIFHAFSNGGVQSLAIVLAHLCSIRSHLTRLVGLIVDCAPTPTAQRAIGNGADLFSYSLGLGPIPTAIARSLFFTGLSMQSLVARVFGRRPQLNKNRDTLLTHPELSGVPKLVMYTPGDRFIDHRQIEWLVGRMVTQTMARDVQESLPAATEAVGGGSLEEFRVFTAATGALATVPRSVTVSKDGEEDPSQPLVDMDRKTKDGPHGGLLAAVRFPIDALHVQLLRAYPKQYVRVVGAFLAKL